MGVPPSRPLRPPPAAGPGALRGRARPPARPPPAPRPPPRRAGGRRAAGARRGRGGRAAAPRAGSVAPPAGGTPGYLRLPLRLPRGLAGLADPALARRLGVARGYPGTLAELPEVATRLVRRARWPGAEELVRELVTLPTHSLLRLTDLRSEEHTSELQSHVNLVC